MKENKKTKSGGRKNKKEMLRGFFTFRRVLSAYETIFSVNWLGVYI